jgi:hypothetical protein
MLKNQFIDRHAPGSSDALTREVRLPHVEIPEKPMSLSVETNRLWPAVQPRSLLAEGRSMLASLHYSSNC